MDGAVEILLVEDNPADARPTREVFEGGRLTTHLNVVADGEEALAFLCRAAARRRAPAEGAAGFAGSGAHRDVVAGRLQHGAPSRGATFALKKSRGSAFGEANSSGTRPS